MRPLRDIITAVQNQQPVSTEELRQAVLSLATQLQNVRGAVWVTPQRTKKQRAAKRRGAPRQLNERDLLPAG